MASDRESVTFESDPADAFYLWDSLIEGGQAVEAADSEPGDTAG